MDDPAGVRLEELPEGIARISFDRPDAPVNALSGAVLRALGEIVDRLVARPPRAVLVASDKPDMFVAGVDLKELVVLMRLPAHERAARAREISTQGQAIFGRLAALPCPTVAVVTGPCLGGGLELALSCRWRLAADSPRVSIGLPEVRLGMIPAWGGCQRLPALLGVPTAVGAILSGRTFGAREALRAGLVDGILPSPGSQEAAMQFVQRLLSGGRPPRRRGGLFRRIAALPPARGLILSRARVTVQAQTHGCYPAPLEALEAIRTGLDRGRGAGLRREQDAISRLAAGTETGHLLRVFFMTPAGGEASGRGGEGAAAARPVARIGVVGAGLMGAGIAGLAARQGIPVRLKDVDAKALAAGLVRIREDLDRWGRRGGDRIRARDAMHRVGPTASWTGFGACDVLVEAVPEILDLKRKVFAEAEGASGEGTILATNTSALSVDLIAQGLRRPERMVGMHFFSPVSRMPLVEVIPGTASDPEAVATVAALARRMDKVVVVARDRPGFLVNRILAPYLREACQMAVEGAGIAQVDRAMLRFGMPMGPFRLLQEVGIPVAQHVARVMQEGFPGRMRAAPLLERMEKGQAFWRRRAGRLGGGGWEPNEPYLTRLLGVLRSESRVAPRPAVPDAEIVDRLVLAQVNEACHALADGVVAGPAEVDKGMVLGTGFAPFRGGLLRYADSLGTRRCRDRLAALAAAHGDHLAPAPLLEEMARSDARFHSD